MVSVLDLFLHGLKSLAGVYEVSAQIWTAKIFCLLFAKWGFFVFHFVVVVFLYLWTK